MGFNCGIVGLPNVGKSTIFNALTSAKAAAANYPFCTIEPNTGIVPVPDSRLEILAQLANSAKIIPTFMEFVDIAGLVKGASQGEGLGNQFLGHIRAVDAIVHVVRCFEDENITHVHGRISPKNDVEVIDIELLLSDLESVERRMERVVKAAKTGNKLAQEELGVLERAHTLLKDGTPIRRAPEAQELASLGLLTGKPVLYIANVAEKDVTQTPEGATGAIAELVSVAKADQAEIAVICGAVEAELQELPKEERTAFLHELGLTCSGLEKLALSGHKLLNLITFFTVGPKEAHAWTCLQGTLAPQAAGKIHSDFEKGFIRAEVIGYQDYIDCGGEVKARERGLLRTEGKTYEVRDGDIVHFRFNV